MPPHAGNVKRIAGGKLGEARVAHGRRKARVALKVGVGEIHQADLLPSGCEFERAGVQIGQFRRRKQGKAAPPHGHAGEIVGHVEVRRDARAIAQPDADERVGRQSGYVVLGAQPGQAGVDGGRADVERRRVGLVLVALEFVEYGVELDHRRLKIETRAVLVIEESPPDLRRPEPGAHRGVAVVTAQVRQCRLDRAPARLHQRPLGHQATQQQRLG